MKTVPLTQGKVALVDDEDYEAIIRFKWCAHKKRHVWYAERAVRTGNHTRHVSMHREIMRADSGDICDHADCNGLNNQKINLRVCTQAGNSQNARISRRNTSGFKGVTFNKNEKKWKAFMAGDFLGTFSDPITAAKAYDSHAIAKCGEYARTNKMEGRL